MALRELLSSSQREAIEAIPVDRVGLIEHYVLNEADLNLIRRRRGNRNRLGFAVQLVLFRFPGRVLKADETPPPEFLNFIAQQLRLTSSVWTKYTQLHEHSLEHID